MDNYIEELIFGYWIDTGGGPEPEYIASVESAGDGTYYGVLFNLKTAQTQADADFPGVALVDGNTVFLRVELAAVGNPALVGLAMQIDWILTPDPLNDPLNGTEAHDYAPQAIWPDSSDYLRVAGR